MNSLYPVQKNGSTKDLRKHTNSNEKVMYMNQFLVIFFYSIRRFQHPKVDATEIIYQLINIPTIIITDSVSDSSSESRRFSEALSSSNSKSF